MPADRKKIAVLDLTHGGILIAQKLSELGFDVSAIDVYNTVDGSTIADLQDNFNISVSKTPLDVEGFDAIIAPVHLDPAYEMLHGAREKNIDIISHHRIVSDILSFDERLSGLNVIEVTGTKAKTSTSSILADIISRKRNVVLHTSRGLEHWVDGKTNLLHKGLSIAPGSILKAVDITFSSGMIPDVFIFEVSIGGTGFADIGIITTLDQDYRIASQTSWASDAKLQMVENSKDDSVLVLNCKSDKAVQLSRKTGRRTFTFSDSVQCMADVNTELEGHDIIISSQDGSVKAQMREGYDIGSYSTAYAAASAAAIEMGYDMGSIADVLGQFTGLHGRMREQYIEDRLLIDNSNSGMDIGSVEASLDYALGRKAQKILMVLGEEAAQVCEGLPPADVASFVEQRGGDLNELILVGERMKGMCSDRVHYAGSLEDGLALAVRLSEPDDIVISCVKCFR